MPDADPTTPRPPLPRSVLVIFAGSLAILLAAGVWFLIATRPARPYPASTPDEMLDSMALMVQRRQAGRLVELIEVAPPADTTTDRDRMGDLYLLLGRVLDDAQRLADATAERFPRELEDLRASVDRGETPSLFGAMAKSAAGRRGNRQPAFGGFGGNAQQQHQFGQALSALLADPYAKLAEGRDRLTTTPIDSDTEALLWDGRPIMPPIGLLVRRQDDGRWNLVPPTALPGVSRVLPHTESEYEIWGSLLATLDNVFVDLEKDVRAGRLTSLEQLSDRAVEKAIVPMGMVMVAYGRAMEDRDRKGDAAP
ncbi:MAG: hypothetical protein R3B49_06830 [Phycisphaerales bacterium]